MSTKRSRDWAAYYSEDEDGQVPIIPSVDQNGAVSYSRQPAVSQKTGMRYASSIDSGAEPAESSSSRSTPPPVKAKPRKQQASIASLYMLYATKTTQSTDATMELLLEHFDAFRAAILAREREPSVGNPCACNKASASAIYRCTECFARGPLCHDCIVGSHQHMPLHWIEKWDGSTGKFIKDSLSNLGLVISLGHNARRCPNAIYGPESGRLMTIIHTNGIHKMRIVHCACTIRVIPDAIQLAYAGFFPATMEAPRTVFTFQLLKDFDVHNRSTKKSVQTQCAEIQHLTSQASPLVSPVRF
jgi:CxC2 like cysteine cluster associated with KDZ transposases